MSIARFIVILLDLRQPCLQVGDSPELTPVLSEHAREAAHATIQAFAAVHARRAVRSRRVPLWLKAAALMVAMGIWVVAISRASMRSMAVEVHG